MAREAACDEDLPIETFERDCLILHGLLNDRNNASLSDIEWCGLRLVDVVSEAREFFRRTPKAPPREDGHGFRPLFQIEGFKGAYARRAAKWRLPRLVGAAFPAAKPAAAILLEQKFSELRHEFQSLSGALDDHPDSSEVVQRGTWRAIIIDGPAGRHPSFQCDRFPALSLFLQRPDYCRAFGFCMFLRMDAPTALHPHVGSTNLRLRCHLALEVDTREPRAVLIVDGQPSSWEEGKCLVFDDSFVHAAVHEHGAPRIVLNLDIWHPDLSPEERATLSHPVFARFGKAA